MTLNSSKGFLVSFSIEKLPKQQKKLNFTLKPPPQSPKSVPFFAPVCQFFAAPFAAPCCNPNKQPRASAHYQCATNWLQNRKSENIGQQLICSANIERRKQRRTLHKLIWIFCCFVNTCQSNQFTLISLLSCCLVALCCHWLLLIFILFVVIVHNTLTSGKKQK